jgi:hypothetical protein
VGQRQGRPLLLLLAREGGRGIAVKNTIISNTNYISSNIGVIISEDLDKKLREIILNDVVTLDDDDDDDEVEKSSFSKEPLMSYTNRVDKQKIIEQVDDSLKQEKKMAIYLNKKAYIRGVLNHVVWHDVCVNGCCVFAGDTLRSLECCPKCKRNRFLDCVQPGCKKRGRCNCRYKDRKRVSAKSVSYRSVITWISGLLSTKSFLDYINFSNKEPPSEEAVAGGRAAGQQLGGGGDADADADAADEDADADADAKEKERVYPSLYDVREGSIMKKNMDDMERIYRNECRFRSPLEPPLVMVNLCFSAFIDGAQTSTWIKVPWEPAVIWILNLPPHMRIKSLIGVHQPFVYQMQKGSEVERFLFKQCLVKELMALKKGMVITCPITNKTFFLQGRLINTPLDTPQLGDTYKMTIQRGYFGCAFCGGNCPGKGPMDGISMCFSGHRQWLARDSFLRSCGQTQFCCPKDFYSDYNKSTYKGLGYPKQNLDKNMPLIVKFAPRTLNNNATSTIMRNQRGSQRSNPFICGDLCSSDPAWRREVYNSVLSGSNSSAYSFEHTDVVDKQLFSDHLYYPTCDYRKSPNNGENRFLSDEKYYSYAQRAQSLNESYATCMAMYPTIAALLKKFDKFAGAAGAKTAEEAKRICYDRDLHALLRALQDGRTGKKPGDHKDVIFTYHPNGDTTIPKLRFFIGSDYCKLIWIEGFSGTSYFHDLKLCFKETARFGPWHGLCNLSQQNLWLMNKSDRAHTNKMAQFCLSTHCHPSLHPKNKKNNSKKNGDVEDNTDKAKGNLATEDDDDDAAVENDEQELCRWEIDPKTKAKIDAMVNSILVPLGHSQDFQFSKGIFENMDQLKGSGKLQCFSILIELIMFWSGDGLDVAYKSLWLIFSQCLMEIQRPYASTDPSILKIYQARLVEYICLHEGLFPLNESTFALHQIFDIKKSLDGWSSIKDVWEVGGERTILSHKRMRAKVPGGRKKDYEYIKNVIYHSIERSLAVFDIPTSDLLSFAHSSSTASSDEVYSPASGGGGGGNDNNSSSSASYNTAVSSSSSDAISFQRRLSLQLLSNTRLMNGIVHHMPQYMISLTQPVLKSYYRPDYRHVFTCEQRGELFLSVYKHSRKMQENYHDRGSSLSVFEKLYKGLLQLYKELKTGATSSAFHKFLKKEAFFCRGDKVNIGLDLLFTSWLENNNNRKVGVVRKKSKYVDAEVTQLYNWAIMYSQTFLASTPRVYASAYIYGTQYRGLESHLQDRPAEELRNHWHLSGSSRAWCHVHGLNDDKNLQPYVRNLGHTSDCYAQLGQFFRLSFPADPNVHNVPFGTLVVYKTFRARVIEEADYKHGDVSITDRGLMVPHYQEFAMVDEKHCGKDTTRPDGEEQGFVALERIGSPAMALGFYKNNFLPPKAVRTGASDREKLCINHRDTITGSLPFNLGAKHLQYLAKENTTSGKEFYANQIVDDDPSKISFIQLVDLEPIDYLYRPPVPTHGKVKYYQNNPELDKQHKV